MNQDSKAARLGYVPALDGLRAVAIASVVGLHATGFPPAGGLGVTLFFVLSGFLITTLLLQEHADNGRVSFRAFYRRRAYRLLPALAVLLVVYVLVMLVVGAVDGEWPTGELAMAAIGATYLMNFVIVGNDVEHIGHLWSLAAEEQFYLVWPLVLFAVLRARIGLGLVAVIAGITASTVALAVLHAADESFSRIWYGPDVTALPILAGCLLGLVFTRWRESVLRFGHFAGVPAALVFAALLLFPLAAFLQPPMLLLAVTCCVGLIAGALSSQPLGRALSPRPVVWVGAISYSLYLWQEVVIAAFGVKLTHFEWWSVPAIVVSVALAAASYYLVERPFLRRKRAKERVRIATKTDVRPVPAAADA